MLLRQEYLRLLLKASLSNHSIRNYWEFSTLVFLQKTEPRCFSTVVVQRTLATHVKLNLDWHKVQTPLLKNLILQKYNCREEILLF